MAVQGLPPVPAKRPSLIPGAIIFFLIGAGLIYGGRRTQARYDSYPTTKGRVVSSRIEESQGSDGHRDRLYGVRAEYTFAVEGKAYAGHTVHPMMESSSSHSSAVNELARYPAGKEVDVHYNPADPSSCFLECKTDSFCIALQIGGVVVILLGILGLTARAVNPEA
ncbi:MAG: DUF3592 domain-containing protein [Planctomycetes bacterium]|nr:DUF3592 domain-containing protein [Planctomycetota bacterium]